MTRPQTPGGTVWFCVRRNGRPRRDGWMDAVPLSDFRGRVEARPDEVVEVCIPGRFRTVAAKRFSRTFFQRARGLAGMEIGFRGETVRLAPTRMIASNLGFERALEKFIARKAGSFDEFRADGRLRAFDACQLLLPGETDDGPVKLFRGSTLVAPTPPGDKHGAERLAEDLADGIGRWMVANLAANGALPYKYWPSRGTDSPADNAIRRFLGSLSLARLGALRDSEVIRESARRNLRFNLGRYFRDIGGGRGAIVEPTGAKLGAAALAGLAILESPARDEFRNELSMLFAGIDSLAHEALGFRTFFFPSERDGDNWNFYSGEALLFWAEAARRGLPGAPALERCVAVFRRCRERHRRKRNPAFVPWHTQACASLFAQTGDREFADFALDINDWLLPMQQWDGLAPDLRGRFYDPHHPEFGPPHASSTGVYLEGLADAAALARAVGDWTRASAYERTIARGLRSLRQLQFRGEHDAFYISKRTRVLGALRTEAYDNAVRVDSAAHALMAAIRILEPVKLGALGSRAGTTPEPAARGTLVRAAVRRRAHGGGRSAAVAAGSSRSGGNT